MAGQLLLINPRKRRASGTKRRRSAAQRAATARLVAHNRARRSTSVRKVTRHRRRSTSVARYAPNPSRKIRSNIMRHRRRNPATRTGGGMSLGFTTGKLIEATKTAAVAAGGALAVDYAYGFVKTYLPVSMQSPVDSTGAMQPLYYLGKGLVAVALGVFGAKAIGGKTATKMAEGSLIVTMYAALRNLLPTSLTSGLGYYQPAATLTPDLPGQMNQSMRGPQASISDLRAYVAGTRSARAKTAYDNPGMGAYVR